jgi:pimeloyl-ACP methyl ester carboxylesterase
VIVMTAASNTTAPTQLLRARNETYAYRRFGSGRGQPLVFLQHFTGTLDNWDPAVTDPLASEREVILFDNAGVGRSTGRVPTTIAGMASHALDFLDSLGLDNCDVLGFSLGGMVALQMAQERPSMFRRMILVGTAPRGGEDIMHLEKPSLARHLVIRRSRDTRCCRSSSLRRLPRVKRPAERSPRGWHDEKTISTLPPHRTSPPRRSQRFVSGNNSLGAASPISRAFSSPPSSSTAFTTK